MDFNDLEDFENDVVLRKVAAPVDEKPCLRCCGTGQIRYGYVNITHYPCSLCKGTGKITDQRVKRVAAAKKAARTLETNRYSRQKDFSAKHPKEWAWLNEQNERGNTFAQSLYEQVQSPRGLSEKQFACITRSLEKMAEAKVDRAASAPDLGAEAMKMIQVFQKAKENGYKKPKIRTELFNFSLAPAGGANAGWVYVTNSETTYIGKINPEGKFVGYKTPAETLSALIEVCKDPLEASIKYGRRTGNCSCCGRALDNKESVELGIGPICRSKFYA